jgi:hypothetical protein
MISLVIITALPILLAPLFFIQDENIMKDGIGTGYKVTHLNHTFRCVIKIHFYMSVCCLCLLLIYTMLPNQTTAQVTYEASPKMCLIILLDYYCKEIYAHINFPCIHPIPCIICYFSLLLVYHETMSYH